MFSKGKILSVVLVLAVLGGFLGFRYIKSGKEVNWREVEVKTAPMRITVPAAGTIEPKNHIVVMAPVNGRVDKILVEEGQRVKEGQIIAWMSSADRAALLDMAKAQGAAAVKKWDEEFRPTPIVSPAAGLVIQNNIVPGQTVTTQSKLVEVSDELIVRAEVDETDIAQVRLGQKVDINVDAFADTSMIGRVTHIAHKSNMINNVTMYAVEIRPEKMDANIRAGMTASVNFVIQEKSDAKVLPTWIASGYEDAELKLFVKDDSGRAKEKTVRVGKSNGDFIEILEGLSLSDVVMYLPVEILTESKSPLGLFQKKGK